MIKPKVTVLMPAYNAERYIEEAVGSILNQTFQNFELIIIDDCSTDSTWQIIQSFKSRRKITAIRNIKNMGGSKTLIKGFRLSKGKYIAIADNDDLSLPSRLEKQVKYLDKHPNVGIVGGSMELIDENNNPIEWRKYHLTDNEIRKYIYRYSPFSHPLVMYRKKILDKVGYYDPIYAPADDYELYFRIGTKSKFANLPDVLLRYRIVANSMTHAMTKRMELATIKVRNKYINSDLYRGTIYDKLYTFLQYNSAFIIPPKIKIWLFKLIRDSKIKN